MQRYVKVFVRLLSVFSLSTISFFVFLIRMIFHQFLGRGCLLDLGRLMASSCRQKILETLSRVGQTHMMDLIRKVNSTYTQVNRNLRILEQEYIVESQYYGRMRIIRLNRKNPKTEVLLKALSMLKRQHLVGNRISSQRFDS